MARATHAGLGAWLIAAAFLGSGCQALLGQRTLGGDWTPVENQTSVGLSITTAPRASGLRPELGVMFSFDRANPPEVEAHVVELFGGVRKNYGGGSEDEEFRGYAGAGISLIGAEFVPAGGPADEDTALGVYVHMGVHLSEFLAIDVRYVLGTSLNFASGSHDVNGLTISLVFGPPDILDALNPDE